jgi:CrcB protein
MIALLVGAGALIGAPARYLIDRAVQSRLRRATFPLGTVTVNVVASVLLGVLAGAAAGTRIGALLGTGFCGTLSTYSTFSFETMRLADERRPGLAVANVVISLLAGIGAAALGWWLGLQLG